MEPPGTLGFQLFRKQTPGALRTHIGVPYKGSFKGTYRFRAIRTHIFKAFGP